MGQGGLSFYVGAKGRYWSKISHRKLKISISHDVVILASEPDAMLNGFNSQKLTRGPKCNASDSTGSFMTTERYCTR